MPDAPSTCRRCRRFPSFNAVGMCALCCGEAAREEEHARIVGMLDNPPPEYHEAVGSGWPASANDATDWWASYLRKPSSVLPATQDEGQARAAPNDTGEEQET